MTGSELLQALIFFSPAVVGIAVAIFKIDALVGWADSLSNWIIRKLEDTRQGLGFLKHWLFRPFFWCLAKIVNWTEGIKNTYARAGLRLALFAYFVATFIQVAMFAFFMIVMVILAIFAIWIAIAIVGGDSKPSPNPINRFKNRRGPYKNTKVKVDENGNMLDDESIYPWKVAEVTDDGKVTDSNAIFGAHASVKTDGKIKEDFSDDEIGYIK